MQRNRLAYFWGSLLTVAVLTFAVLALPTDAMARNWNECPPNQINLNCSKNLKNSSWYFKNSNSNRNYENSNWNLHNNSKNLKSSSWYFKNSNSNYEKSSSNFNNNSRNFKMLVDIKGHWAAEPIIDMQKRGFVTGFDDGRFYPQRDVTKAEAMVMIMRTLGFEGETPTEDSSDLVDDLNPKWARDMVALALDEGLITKRELKKFDGNDPASRYEVAVWIARAIGNEENADRYISFVDEDSIPKYARNYVAYLTKNGIMKGYPGNRFKPHNSVIRAEIVVMLYRCQNGYNGDKYEYNEAPEIDKLNPKDGAYNVDAGLKKLVVTFDEDIYAVASELAIESAIEIENVTENEEVDIRDIDIDDEELVIELEEGLEEDCKYSVYIPSNIIKDEDGNKFEGIDEGDWEFTTAEDNNEPEIDKLDPKDGAYKVEAGLEKLVVTFSEDIYAVASELAIESEIEIENLTENEDVEIRDIDIDDEELVIELEEGLEEDCKYSISIPSYIIMDEDGNRFDGIDEGDWEFITAEDTNEPEIEELDPRDGAYNVEAGLKTLVVTFDEDIYAVASELEIESAIEIENVTENEEVDIRDIDISGEELVIKLEEGLAENCKYSITIPSYIIEDEDDNRFDGIDEGDWEFITVED